MVAACVGGTSPVQSMTTRPRRFSCRVVLAAVLATAAVPAVAQPIEAESQDVFSRPAGDDAGRDQGWGRQESRRGPYPVGRHLGAGSPDLSAAPPWSRGPVGGVPYGAYGGYGANGAGMDHGTMAWSGGDDGAYDEDRQPPAAPFGRPGGWAQFPSGTSSPYGGPAVNGTASGPQYSNQLPGPRDRFRR